MIYVIFFNEDKNSTAFASVAPIYVVVITLNFPPRSVNSINSRSRILIPFHLMNETSKSISSDDKISFLNSLSRVVPEFPPVKSSL